MTDIFLRNNIWRAGAKNAQIRGLAAELFRIQLTFPTFINIDAIRPVLVSDIVPVVISNLDDDLVASRKTLLGVVDQLLQLPLWDGIIF